MADDLSRTTASSASSRRPKSCDNCARAKVKCDFGSVADAVCTRCRRLHKDCVTLPPVTRRRRKQVTRVAQLEEKIDGLVAFLGSSHQPSRGLEESKSIADPIVLQTTCPPPLNSRIPRDGGHYLGEAGCSTEELRRLLREYRRRSSGFFPFVSIPDDVEPQKLYQQKPFLFKTIIIANSHNDTSRRRRLMEVVMAQLSDSLLVKGDKSLDMLQGLLVLVAWCSMNWHADSQMEYFIHLARAMATELGLSKAPPVMERLKDAVERGTPTRTGTWRPRVRTLEERRSMLGCYYSTVIMFASLKKVDPIRWTPYLDDCCQVLLNAQELPSDQYLVYFIRLQQLIQKMGNTLPHDESSVSRTVMAPVGLHVRSLQCEVKAFQNSLPLELQQNHFMLMQLHAANVYLYEPALYDLPVDASYGDHPLQRIDLLFALMSSAKAFLDMFVTIPVSEYLDLPTSVWVQSGYVITVASRLSLQRIEGWDLTYARKMLRVGEVLERSAANFEEASKLVDAGEQREDNLFLQYAVGTRFVKTWYEQKLVEEGEREVQQQSDMDFLDLGFDFLDQNIFGDLNFWDANMDGCGLQGGV